MRATNVDIKILYEAHARNVNCTKKGKKKMKSAHAKVNPPADRPPLYYRRKPVYEVA